MLPQAIAQQPAVPPAREDSAAERQTTAPIRELPPPIEPAPVAAVVAPTSVEEVATPEKSGQEILDETLDFCNIAQEYWQKGDLENALEALDQAYSLLLNIAPDDSDKLLQQKEDLRFLVSKRILEIYASRHIVVNGSHNAIPRTLNRYVQSEINLLAKGKERDFFIASYKRSGRYRDFIVQEFKSAGIPVELSWLPLIESGFKTKALSRARALGMWQFISSTGYKFGLKRDKYVDERLDPIKSTHSAIAYLTELHKIFGDWTTALAAYNCGENRVLRLIRTQNIHYLDNFWDLYERLPRETARYVPRFLATLHIVQNLKKYGLDQIPLDPPMQFETVNMERQVHLKSVAQTMGLPYQQLIDLNPELRYGILPPEPYALRVPPGKSQQLLANQAQIPLTQLPQRSYVTHRVRSGETLSTIARKYRSSVSRIMRANNLRRSHFIRVGQRLKIPRRGTVMQASTTKTNETRKPSSGTHVVRSGDNLWKIANRYGTTTLALQKLNNLSSTRLSIGQVLKLPGAAKKSQPTRGYDVYAVKSGDSPFIIAKRNSMSLKRLLQINNLTPRSKIYPGQQLYIE